MPKFGKDVPDDGIPTISGQPGDFQNPENKKRLLDETSRQTLGATSFSSLKDGVFGGDEKQKAIITKQLLLAVAYGMESKAVNTPIKPSDTGGLFNSDLFAEDLLKKSPEFLLERAHVTDWAGRTFKGRITEEHPEGEGITAFQYAVWAKDFKMIAMMINCLNEANISEEEHEHIRVDLLGQYQQVTFPKSQGGGLTYTHTYERPNLNAKGIPQKDASGNWDCERVTVVCDENHFDLTPLIKAYVDYNMNFCALTRQEQDAYWTKRIASLQRLLPVHILQRYCDPNTPFHPLVVHPHAKAKTFHGAFSRSVDFYNPDNKSYSSIFGSSLASGFALKRAYGPRGLVSCSCISPVVDLEALRLLDKVSTNEIKNIIGQLSEPRHSAGLRPS